MAAGGYTQLNTLLCIGGISMAEQSHVFNKGLHIVVATPGRLIDMLEKKRFNFESCKYMCMDEADRMIDLGFEDDVRNIMSFFKVSDLNIVQSNNFVSTLYYLASKANATFLGYYATENPRVCPTVAGTTCSCQRRASRCGKLGRASSCRIRETRSQDGLSAGMSSKDSSARHHLQ
jgi:DEAD/DEAH box helicase